MPLIYYLSSATASAVDSCVRAIGGLVPPICHHLCSRTSPAGPARRFAITFARATCNFFPDFFFIFWKSDQPWGPKIDGFIMENTPMITRRTYVEFCLSFTVIKKSSQISAKSPNLSFQNCFLLALLVDFVWFFLFFKKLTNLEGQS